VIVPRPERLRTLEGTSFAWLATAILRDGWLRVLPPQATAVYAFLCLAADRQGVSYYRRGRIGHELGLDDGEIHRALTRLQQLDLVAYRPFGPHAVDGFRQVLAVPRGGPPPLLSLPMKVLDV
jgi:hypothetical protein